MEITDGGEFDDSWETAVESDTEEELVAVTTRSWTSDENVYGEQADAKVATFGDPIPTGDQIRDAPATQSHPSTKPTTRTAPC